MTNKITGFALRRPITVIVIWLALVGAGFGIGTGVFSKLTPDIGTVPTSESGHADQRLQDIAPRPQKLTAVISGKRTDDPALRQSLASALTAVRAVPGITSASQPLPSAKGDALLVEVVVAPKHGKTAAAKAAARRLRHIDANVAVSGGPLSDAEFSDQAQQDVTRAEMLSMPVMLILLLIVFGGLLAAGLPLLIAVVGIGSTFGVLYAFSSVTHVSVYAIQITTMLAVGLAVDYALLMVSRFRDERRTAADVATAVTRTTATAGRTVVFSGLTVATALIALTVFPDPFLRSMGLAGASVVLVDMAAALTLLPALLTRLGGRISPAKERTKGGIFARVAHLVQRRPLLTLAATVGVMVTLAIPALSLHISQGDPRMLPTSTATSKMWNGLTTHFPERAQWGGSILVLVDTPSDSRDLLPLRRSIAAMPTVTDVQTTQAGPKATLFQITPRGPGDAPARDAVRTIRDLRTPFKVEVTGDTARMMDYNRMLAERLPWAVGLMALATIVLLFALTGSVVLPVKAVLTNMLSLAAALGIVVWVFQRGHLAELVGSSGLGYVHLTVPVLVGAIAFGLSVDYEVFLLSGIRERWLAGAGPRGSVAEGLQRTGGIVTMAALLITVVFAGFVLGGFVPIKSLGLGLVMAIVLDATIVRMLMVPATMTLLGRRNWWLPKPLRHLHTHLPQPEPAV